MQLNRTITDTPAAQISRTAVQILREYTGRGPTKARTSIGHDCVTVVLGDALTHGERTLVERGKGQRVLDLRHDFQLEMRDDLVEMVETALDRKVIAFMSDNHIEPDVAVEVFILQPLNGSVA